MDLNKKSAFTDETKNRPFTTNNKDKYKTATEDITVENIRLCRYLVIDFAPQGHVALPCAKSTRLRDN